MLHKAITITNSGQINNKNNNDTTFNFKDTVLLHCKIEYFNHYCSALLRRLTDVQQSDEVN